MLLTGVCLAAKTEKSYPSIGRKNPGKARQRKTRGEGGDEASRRILFIKKKRIIRREGPL